MVTAQPSLRMLDVLATLIVVIENSITFIVTSDGSLGLPCNCLAISNLSNLLDSAARRDDDVFGCFLISGSAVDRVTEGICYSHSSRLCNHIIFLSRIPMAFWSIMFSFFSLLLLPSLEYYHSTCYMSC